MAKPPGNKPPIAGLVDLFSDEFGSMAGPIVEDIKKGIAAKKSVRSAVEAALAKHSVTNRIQNSVLDKLVSASAIGFGVDPKLVVDPVGIRKSFLNSTWAGDGLSLSKRIAREEYKTLITDTISAQMSRARSWQQTADALVAPLRAGGPGLVRGDVAQRIDDLATSARRVAAGDPAALKAFKGQMAAARRHVNRLSLNGAPNQTLKTIYKDVIRAAETLNTKALDSAMQQAVRDKARYNAERIARTEIARAYGAGEDLAQMEDEDVIAERWMLSSRHPAPDICSVHAQADFYGMGPGVYPKDRKPAYPAHPSCLCIKVRVYVGEVDLNEKMDPGGGAAFLAKQTPVHRNLMLGVKGAEDFDRDPSSWKKSLRGWQGHAPVQIPRGLKPEMFTGPAGFAELPVEQLLAEKVAIVEKRIRKQRFETAAAWDPQGNLVMMQDGEEFTVDVSAHMHKFKGGTFTHNHPRGWGFPEEDPRRGGNSFSFGDVSVAAKAEVQEMRAASPGWDHIIKPPPEGWNRQYLKSVLVPTYTEAELKVQNDHVLAVRAGLMTLEMSSSRFYHDVWTRVAEKTGLIYKRVKAPE